MASKHQALEDLPPLVVAGSGLHAPSLDELYRLTELPERRVVFRGVDWAFYNQIVDSLPEGSFIHIDFDGRDLEVVGNGPIHEDLAAALGQFVSLVAAGFGIRCKGLRETTWKRPQIARGLESDQCYYFDAEKLATYARVRGCHDVSLYPDVDLAIEVDISRPAVDRAGIDAALGLLELWRVENGQIIIEQLTAAGTYAAVTQSRFLPVSAQELRRWVVEQDCSDDTLWIQRLQAEVQKKAADRS